MIVRKPRTSFVSCRSTATASQGRQSLFLTDSSDCGLEKCHGIKVLISDRIVLQRSEGIRTRFIVHGKEVCLQVSKKAAEVCRLSSGVHRSLGYVNLTADCERFEASVSY